VRVREGESLGERERERTRENDFVALYIVIEAYHSLIVCVVSRRSTHELSDDYSVGGR